MDLRKKRKRPCGRRAPIGRAATPKPKSGNFKFMGLKRKRQNVRNPRAIGSLLHKSLSSCAKQPKVVHFGRWNRCQFDPFSGAGAGLRPPPSAPDFQFEGEAPVKFQSSPRNLRLGLALKKQKPPKIMTMTERRRRSRSSPHRTKPGVIELYNEEDPPHIGPRAPV